MSRKAKLENCNEILVPSFAVFGGFRSSLLGFVLLFILCVAQTAGSPPAFAARLPSAQDFDADGLPNKDDPCPNIPRPDGGSKGEEFCGPALRKVMHDYLFLWSRTTRLPAGVDKVLLDKKGAFHAFIHIQRRESPVVLPPAERKKLNELGVRLLDYVPHYTWYARFDGPESLRAAAAMKIVRGVSAIEIRDRIEPSLVQNQGPFFGRNEEGTLTLSVTFFEDTDEEGRRSAIRSAGGEFVVGEENEVHVRLKELDGMMALAREDAVQTITDIPGPPANKTDNARRVANLDLADNVFGLTGGGITLAMAEPGIVPFGHPDLSGRVTRRTYNWPSPPASLTIPSFLNLPIDLQKRLSGLTHAQFVGAILAGDGSSLPGRRGILPASELVSFSVIAPLARQRYFSTGKRARRDYDAAVINHSWGPPWGPVIINQFGRYTDRGRFLDKVVHDEGLPVVWAAGNERCDPAATPGCAPVPSLPHPVAKNDISVGNVNANTGQLENDSSAGPAADGRLKPDIVAPGDLTLTVKYAPFASARNRLTAVTFGGTSASAPVVSGVVGMMSQAFVNRGIQISQIPPELIKAILLETAIDIGPPGPDFLNGYGLLNATEAVRMVGKPANQITGTVIPANTSVDFAFQVGSPRFSLSATLVWTDEPGTTSSTQTLVNDLDLTLVGPSQSSTFLPFDLTSPPATMAAANAGSAPCTNASVCSDMTNNVEKVLVGGDGTPVEQGTWTIRVTASRLVTNSQNFAIAISAPCPVVVGTGQTLTLADDLECGFGSAVPAAVVLNALSSRLDCNGFTIRGNGWNQGTEGQYVGVLAKERGNIVQNCTIEEFDTGIKFSANSGSAAANNNTLQDLGSAGVFVEGINNGVRNNTIRRLRKDEAAGVRVLGAATNVTDNVIGPRPPVANPAFQETGVFWDAVVAGTPLDARPGTVALGSIARNEINGATFGIVVDGVRSNIHGLRVEDNEFEGTRRDAITVSGNTNTISIKGNEIQGLGRNGRGIVVIDSTGTLVNDNEVGCGAPNLGTKTGIELRRSTGGTSGSNTISSCGVGINDTANTDVPIRGNSISIDPLLPTGGVGIASSSSTATVVSDHLAGNTITNLETGIVIQGKVTAGATMNMIEVEGRGVVIAATPDSPVVEVSGNTSASETRATIAGNQISGFSLAGIELESDAGSVVDQNELTIEEAVGIRLNGGSETRIAGNTLEGVQVPATRGLVIGDSQCKVTNNPIVEDNTFSMLEIATNIKCTATNLTFTGNGITQSEDAIIQQQGAALTVNGFERNRFESNTRQATFVAPVIGRQNIWGDVGSLRILDNDADGFGDCGEDFPYTSQVFGGSTTAENGSALSVQVQDTEPATSAQGNCPP